jgi:hypothetical protein
MAKRTTQGGGKKKQKQPDAQGQPAAAAPEFPMALPRKHLDVIEQIFWQGGSHRGSIRWSDFEATMGRIGAKIEQGEGTRVAFTINGLRAVIWRPKELTLQARKLRDIETKLAAVFTWTRESFVLAER